MDSTKRNSIDICSVVLKIRRLIKTQTNDISSTYSSKNTLRNLSLCFIIRSNPGMRGEVYPTFKTFRLTLGPNRPLIQWVQGSFRGVKAAGREGNHSPPSSIEVKNSKVVPVLCLEGLDRGIYAFL
jgi:hypothetical protein